MKHGLKIGQDMILQERRDQYDVVLITIGASTDKKLGLEGEDGEGILSAVEFLMRKKVLFAIWTASFIMETRFYRESQSLLNGFRTIISSICFLQIIAE